MKIIGSFWPSLVVDEAHADKIYPLSNVFSEFILEMGYMHLQATKPDTIGKLNYTYIYITPYVYQAFS